MECQKSGFIPFSWHICTIYGTSHQYLNRQHSRYYFTLKVTCFDWIFFCAIENTTCCTTSCHFPGPWDKPLLLKVSESENHCLKRKKAACTEPKQMHQPSFSIKCVRGKTCLRMTTFCTATSRCILHKPHTEWRGSCNYYSPPSSEVPVLGLKRSGTAASVA